MIRFPFHRLSALQNPREQYKRQAQDNMTVRKQLVELLPVLLPGGDLFVELNGLEARNIRSPVKAQRRPGSGEATD